MPLFDWPAKEKTRAEARAERDTEWEVWIYKKSLAEAGGELFDEPSPADRDRAMGDRSDR